MKIDIITGSRAEYGIMRNLIKKIKEDSYFESRIIVTGMHLEKKYGYTINDIINDGYDVEHCIDSNMKDTSRLGTLNSIEVTFKGFKELYTTETKPDAVIILGDRYEVYAAASVCAFLMIPIIHIHGGEKTEGNYDEFIRHAITKLSSLHFASSKEFRKRIIQLGEQPDKTFNVGSLGVENVINTEFIELLELSKKYNIKLEEKKYFVIAFHPETLTKDEIFNEELLKALNNYVGKYKFIFIGANSDTGSDVVMNNINNFIKKVGDNNAKLFLSIPTIEYHSFIKNGLMLIGNSSSGLIEVPSLGKPTVNIGERQKGRLQGNSVFNCDNKSDSIIEAIELAISFHEKINNPYQGNNPCEEIIETIKVTKLDVIKKFYDLGEKNE